MIRLYLQTVYFLTITLLTAKVCQNTENQQCREDIKRIPIWLDSDPGNDDCMAIMMSLFDERSELLGISTTFGNKNVAQTTLNAVKLLSTFNRLDIPVIQGAHKALYKTKFTDASHVHGEEGMFGANLLQSLFKHIEDETDGIRSIHENLQNLHLQRQEKITIIVLGPTTNIAKLLTLYSSSVQYIEQIVIMGGSITEGNITPYAEFNVYTDAEALEIVIRVSIMQGLRVSLIPLDVTSRADIVPEYIEIIKTIDTRIGRWSSNLLEKYRTAELASGFPYAGLHDAITVYYCLYPEQFTGDMFHVKVNSDQDSEKYGQTHMTENNPNIFVTTNSHFQNFWLAMTRSIKYYRD